VYDANGSNRRENITDWALGQFRAHYGDESISKWDIFYYVYGLLHHPGYRERYADNLKRELPRIPFAPAPIQPLPPAPSPLRREGEQNAAAGGFWAFSEAGKALAELHLNYETVKPFELEWVTKPGVPVSYRVEKMRLIDPHPSPPPPAGEGANPLAAAQGGEQAARGYRAYGAIQVNDTLTLKGIPAEAFGYRLGNRSALEWVVDQYHVSEDKRSGIVSDPNGYSENERYIVDLVEKVVRVSVETVKIVDELQKVAFRG
jgi:predicted helicase